MFCSNCGAPLRREAKFCTSCGKAAAPPRRAAPSGETEGAVPRAVPSAALPQTIPMPPASQVPAQARRTKGSKVSPVALAAIVVGCLALLSAAAVVVLLSGGDGTPKGRHSSVSAADAAADSAANWSDFEGCWRVDSMAGTQFSVTPMGGAVKVSVQQEGTHFDVTCDAEREALSGRYSVSGSSGRLTIERDGQNLVLTITTDTAGGPAVNGAKAVRTTTVSDESRAQLPVSGAKVDLPTAYLYYDGEQTRARVGVPEAGGDFQFWPTDILLMTNADLVQLTQDEIQAVRNEIFARYGYPFSDTENGRRWKALFGGMDWYTRDESYQEPAALPSVVRANIDTIVAYEIAQGWR